MTSTEWKQLHPERWKAHQLKYRLKKRNSCRECKTEIPFPKTGGKYCSIQCSQLVRKRNDKESRQQVRLEVDVHKVSLGCTRCGYNKCGAALDWHHTDNNKERRITIRTYFTELGKAERDKCVLLCANCHREEHHHQNIHSS